MIEDVEKMDENKKKDTLKRMSEMADLNAIRQIKECLSKNEKGDIKGTVQNYMMIFRDDPLIKGCLRYNRLSERVDISRKLWWDEDWEILTDNAIDQFYLYFEVYYGLGNEKNLYKALQIEATNRAYHPICEYLETLKWDGEERIRYVLKKYMGADDSDYVYEVLKHFMMEALLRVFYPGIKADEMLCLVGQQGAGKSTFFRFLSLKDNWFSDDLRDLGDKKVFESIRGHWIIEMSEMIAAISAKSNEEIKSFLSRQKDTYRTAYARFEKDRKRQCVFAGSTNTYQFIPFDRTGARRFLPIMIDASKAEKHILDDEEEARAYFNQLWAEAMIIYHSEENKGNLLKFTKEMQKEIDEYRKQFMQEDTLAGTIQGWLDNYKGNYVCSIQIWSEAFNHGDREPKKYETILTAPITVPLAKKFGKKEVSIVGLAISVVSYIVIFVTRVTSPYVYLVLIFFAFFGIGIMSMVSYAMTNDCVDNHYLETGDRVEGTVYAMASFVRKMAGAVCTGIGGWALTWIGYNELAVTQTEEVRQALFNIIVGLPLLCFALTLIFMLFYPLNKKRVEENEKKMEALRSKEQ